MREARRKAKEARSLPTTILPKSLVRLLQAKGIDPTKYVSEVSLSDYRDLKRQLEAKIARVEWQSGGIRGLQEEIRTLEAFVQTQASFLHDEQVIAVTQRVAQLEADFALHEAVEQGPIEEDRGKTLWEILHPKRNE